MKRIGLLLLAVVAAVGLSGCMMKTVRWGSSLTSPPEARGAAFSDDKIDIEFAFDGDGIAFTLKNKTSQGIKITWDEVGIITEDGVSKRAVHEGVRLMEKGATQPPSVVPPKSALKDSLTPSESVYFTAGQYGGWKITPLCDPYREPTTREGMKLKFNPSRCEGKTYGVYLPLEIEGSRKEYSFTLRVDSVTEVKKSNRKRPTF